MPNLVQRCPFTGQPGRFSRPAAVARILQLGSSALRANQKDTRTVTLSEYGIQGPFVEKCS